MARFLLALLLVACRGNGEESEPLTSAAECGTGVAPGSDPRLLRWPYLQRVTSTSAVIVFGLETHLTTGAVSVGRDTDYTTATVSTSADEVPYEDSSEAPKTLQLHAAEITGLSPRPHRTIPTRSCTSSRSETTVQEPPRRWTSAMR
jgi:hypothetical protein